MSHVLLLISWFMALLSLYYGAILQGTLCAVHHVWYLHFPGFKWRWVGAVCAVGFHFAISKILHGFWSILAYNL